MRGWPGVASYDAMAKLTELGSIQELGQSLAIQATVWLGAGRPDLARVTIAEAIALFQSAGAADDLAGARQLLDAAYAEEMETKVHL